MPQELVDAARACKYALLLPLAARGLLRLVPLLDPLSDDQRATFLVVALPKKVLRKLVGQLGVAPRGTRLDSLVEWELADALVDYYHDDAEVVQAVDLALRKELGDSPLATAVAGRGAAQALGELVLAAKDPLRDLAWAVLAHGPAEGGETAAGLVETIIHEFDQADERARADAEAEAVHPSEEAPAPDVAVRAIAKEAAKAQAARARALKRVGGMKDQVADLEERLAAARGELRAERAAREASEQSSTRGQEEIRSLRAQLAGGAAAELDRLRDALARSERRTRALEAELEEAREAEATLASRLRAGEQRAESTEAPDPSERPGSPSTWSLPVFSAEFYDSIRRWDRKIVRTAFEKIHRLADDWRHPSLRAIPLEGLPGHFRIRIASDVRLIYRPLEGGRVEILSLIDREDLQRYIRTAKTRQSG